MLVTHPSSLVASASSYCSTESDSPSSSPISVASSTSSVGSSRSAVWKVSRVSSLPVPVLSMMEETESKSPILNGVSGPVVNSTNTMNKQRKVLGMNGGVVNAEYSYGNGQVYDRYAQANASAAYQNATMSGMNMGMGMSPMQYSYPPGSMPAYSTAAPYLSGGAVYQNPYSMYPPASTYPPMSYVRQSILYPSAAAHHANAMAASEVAAMPMLPNSGDLSTVAAVQPGAGHPYYAHMQPSALATHRGMPGMIAARYPMSSSYALMNEAANAAFSLPYHSINPLLHSSGMHPAMDPNGAVAANAYAQSVAAYSNAMERQKKMNGANAVDSDSSDKSSGKSNPNSYKRRASVRASPAQANASNSPSSPTLSSSSSSASSSASAASFLRVRVLLRSERGKRFRSRLVRMPLNQSLSQLLFRAVSINKFVSVRVSDGRGEAFFGNEEQSMSAVLQKLSSGKDMADDGDDKNLNVSENGMSNKRKKLAYQGGDERFDSKAHELFFMHDDEWTVAHRAAALKLKAQEHSVDSNSSSSLAALSAASDSDLLVCFILDDQVKSCPRLGCQNLLFKHSHRRSCLTCAKVGWEVPAGQIRKLVLKVELRKKRKIGGIESTEIDGRMVENNGTQHSKAEAGKTNNASNGTKGDTNANGGTSANAEGGDVGKNESEQVGGAQQGAGHDGFSLSMGLNSSHFNEYEILSKLSFGPFEQKSAGKDKGKATGRSISPSPTSSSVSDYVIPCASLSSLLPSLSVNEQLTLLDSALSKCEHWKFDAEGDFSSFRNLYSSYHTLLQTWLGNRFYDPSEDNSASPSAAAAAATVESKQIVHSIYILFLSESDAKATDSEYYRFLQERMDNEWNKLERMHSHGPASAPAGNDKWLEVKRMLKTCSPLTLCDPAFSYSVKMRSHFWLLQVRKESATSAAATNSSSSSSNTNGELNDCADDGMSDDGFQKDGPLVHGCDRLTASTKNMKLFKKIGKPNQRRMKRKPDDGVSGGHRRRGQSPVDDENDSDDSSSAMENAAEISAKKKARGSNERSSNNSGSAVKKEKSEMIIDDDDSDDKQLVVGESGNESIRSAALVLTQVKRESHSPKEDTAANATPAADREKKSQAIPTENSTEISVSRSKPVSQPLPLAILSASMSGSSSSPLASTAGSPLPQTSALALSVRSSRASSSDSEMSVVSNSESIVLPASTVTVLSPTVAS